MMGDRIVDIGVLSNREICAYYKSCVLDDSSRDMTVTVDCQQGTGMLSFVLHGPINLVFPRLVTFRTRKVQGLYMDPF